MREPDSLGRTIASYVVCPQSVQGRNQCITPPRCVADAPEYFPPEVHTEDCANRAPGFQNHLTEFWGREMDKSCLEFAAEQGVEDVGELCGLTTNFAQFITTPLAILSSHEDSAFTHDFGCEPDPHSPEHEQFR